MGVTIDGNNIVITNATLTLVNGVNTESGVAYIIITPDGGVGAIPFMAQGLPGQPTLFPLISLVQHPAGEALPTPNPVMTLVDAGGAGLPAKYNVEFHINKGDTGLTGTPSISLATDLATSPALGAGTEKFVLVWRNSDAKWVPTAQKIGNVFTPGAAIAATAFNNTTPRLLSSITVPSQNFDWFPLVYAQAPITGTGGSTPTRVSLFARLNDAGSGAQLGYAKGISGANTDGIQTVIIPGPPTSEVLPGTYGKVLAGASATIHLRAEQVAASSSSWSTPASPDITFFVTVEPLP